MRRKHSSTSTARDRSSAKNQSLSSSKKIERAARAASASQGQREKRELLFPIVLVAVLVLGTGMVVLAKYTRPPVLPPSIGDHWHSAYAIYDCVSEGFLPVFQSESDPDGIHSHSDGVVHIHPWNSSATGEDARFDIFFDAMGATVTTNSISGPGIGVLDAGEECNGEPSVIRAVRFVLPEDFNRLEAWQNQLPLRDEYQRVELVTENFQDIQLLDDLEAFTVARVPVGADIPPPPEEHLWAAFNASGGGLGASELLSQGPSELDPPAGLEVGEDTVPSSTVVPSTAIEPSTTEPGTDVDSELSTDVLPATVVPSTTDVVSSTIEPSTTTEPAS